MDAVAVERLGGACRLWGAVKFLHPYLAYRAIDWDAALVATIPRILAVTSADGYRRALDHLLAVLDDPLTCVVGPSPERNTAARADGQDHPVAERGEPHLRWTDDRVAVLVASDFHVLEWQGHTAVLGRLLTEAAEATALVLDLRGAWPSLCSILPGHMAFDNHWNRKPE